MSLYKDRVAAGLCGMCAEPSPDGPCCAACKEKSRLAAAAKRERNKASGKCLNCKRPITVGVRCETCKASARASRKRSTLRKKTAGVCVQSGCHNAAKAGCVLCQTCIDKLSATASEHYRRRKEAGLCRFCNSPPAKAGGSMCAYHQEAYHDYRLQTKLEVFEAYGGAACAECGDIRVELLELHHLSGGGNKHRRELNMEGGGYSFYLWLRRSGFPPGYRVLCPSCHKAADKS